MLQRCFRMVMAVLTVIVVSTIPSVGQDWQRLRLGEAAFEAPAAWRIERRAREREYTLRSPDKTYLLRVEWWLPDEPLLGFSDIVWHRKTTVAGQPALQIYLRSPQSQTLMVALDKLRSDGRQLLIVFEATGKNLANGSPVLDEVLRRLTLSAAKSEGVPQATPAPPEAANQGVGGDATYDDPRSQLSVRYPKAWQRSTAERGGLSVVTLVPPGNHGLLLIAAARAEGGRRADDIIAAYEEQYYQDYVVPDSIEGDGDTRIGNRRGRFVDMLAQVYPIEGVRLAFTDGRSWLFKSVGGPRSYIVAVVHARNAPATSVATLKATAARIVFGSAGTAVTGPAAGASPPPAPEAAAPVATDDPMSKHFGSDCISVDLARWRHPVRTALQARGRARLEWASICRKGAYPVLGVAFELDPQGATRDYFTPLYLDLLAANGRRPFGIVSTGGDIVLKIDPRADGGFALEVADLDAADADAVARGGDGKPVAALSPSDQTVVEAPEAVPAGRVDRQPLFAGRLDKSWQEVGWAGGDFKKFARVGDGALFVDVPTGNGWGKTGLTSVAPVVSIPALGTTRAAALRFAIDPRHSVNFVAALLPAGMATQDDWNHHHVRFAINGKPGAPPELRLWVARAEQGSRVLADGIPTEIELQLLPDGLILLTDGAGNVLLQGTLPEDIAPKGYHVQAIAHAQEAGGTAALALRTIDLLSWPFAPSAGASRSLMAGEDDSILLFDGQIRDPLIERYQAHGGDFAKHAKIDGGALVVDVPAGAKWGKTGFYSPQPVVWFDGEGEAAQTVVTFAFDPDRTTGFVVALSPVSNLNGNDPNNPKALVHWRRDAGGNGLYTVVKDYDKVVDLPAATAAAPQAVRFMLRQGRIKLLLPGARDVELAMPDVASGQGFRLYVYSHPDKADQPVKMALTSILVERGAGTVLAEARPVEGRSVLPEQKLFEAGKPGAWDAVAISEDLKPFVRVERGRLVVDVPEKKAQWAKAGLLFREPVIELNERIETTDLTFSFTFDPKVTEGAQIVVSGDRVADMWGRRRAAVSLVRDREGEAAGHYILSIDADGYRAWARRIPQAWMAANWNGVLEVVVSNGALVARVPGAATVRGANLPIRKNDKLHMVVTSHPTRPYGPARMALSSVTRQWRLPAHAQDLDRWSYVDDAEFVPGKFLDELAGSLEPPVSRQ